MFYLKENSSLLSFEIYDKIWSRLKKKKEYLLFRVTLS